MYIYIYNLYIYIYICVYLYIWEQHGNNTSKKELFSQLVLAVAVFKEYVEFVIYRY